MIISDHIKYLSIITKMIKNSYICLENYMKYYYISTYNWIQNKKI